MNNEDVAPLVNVGDNLLITWKSPEGNEDTHEVSVVSVKKQKECKDGSYFTYKLLFSSGDIRKTRLMNHKFEVVGAQGVKRKKHISDEVCHRSEQLTKKSKILLPTHKHILAPMVGGSELSFRLLCRQYGADLAYTPMMNSEKFAVDSEYRSEIFQTNSKDRPLVCHFAANNPDVLLAAARHVEHVCDAIDLNLGCPQRVAFAGHYGSFLLDPEDRQLICDMVKKLSQNISIPVFVKIRLLDTLPETIELCQQLVDAGASLIAIHGRYRVNLVSRTGPGARDGPAHLDQVYFLLFVYVCLLYYEFILTLCSTILYYYDIVCIITYVDKSYQGSYNKYPYY
jgi:tRNA-dihydrouridine synthase 1